VITHQKRVSMFARLCAALCSLALLTFAGCGGDASANTDAADFHPKVQEISDTSAFTVPHADRFAVIQASERAVTDRLSGTCTVAPDVNRSIPVNALSSGRVVAVHATLGDHVRKGDPLVTMRSPDLSSAIADHQKAAADASLARRQLERARLLFDHGSIARKDLEIAEDADDKARVDVQTTEEHVRLLGGELDQASPILEVRSPIDGTIIEQNVTPGAAVKSLDNSPNLFTVADLSRVWVLCDVYENDLARTQVGEVARIRLNAFPDQSHIGRIANVSQILDPASRTAKVRIELDNGANTMRPGMFATADLESSASRDRVLLPMTALVQLHDATWVFVRVGPTAFRRVQVHVGRQLDAGLQEIVDGISPGQLVVRNALQLVQSAEQ
jgi:cobalt-zinc-cadmium efflux system membrane fusion protein